MAARTSISALLAQQTMELSERRQRVVPPNNYLTGTQPSKKVRPSTAAAQLWQNEDDCTQSLAERRELQRKKCLEHPSALNAALLTVRSLMSRMLDSSDCLTVAELTTLREIWGIEQVLALRKQ